MLKLAFRPFAYFTALTWAGCALLILFFDRPLALFTHRHTTWAVPFFSALTDGADKAHGALMTHFSGLPVLFIGLGLAYVVGRWVLKRPEATVFLVLLLTHIASVVTSNVLKGVVHRLRPEVLFGSGYSGLGLWVTGPHNDSFPSTHVTTYLSLFLPLAVAYPRFRVPLLVLPALMMLGRLLLGAHYLSDVWFSVWLVVGYTLLFGLIKGRRWA
jgi:membrane-associated phospholipid phosphatase